MADLYVRSSDGSDSDNGATWALGKATLAGAAAIDAAGDRIFLASDHAESSGSAITLAFSGTSASPVRIYSASDAAEPPTSAVAGARVVSTGGSVSLSGSVYCYGITFESGTPSGSNISPQANQTYENCNLRVSATNGKLNLGVASNGENHLRLRSVNIKLAGTSARIDISQGCLATWDGGSLEAGSTCTSLLQFSGVSGLARGGRFEINGVDLSGGPTGMHIVEASGSGVAIFKLRNCKLPSGWSGSLFASASTEIAVRAEMWNCSTGSDNISYWMSEPLAGEVKAHAAVYADDFGDGTPHSLRYTSDTNTNDVNRLVGPDLMASVTAGTYTASVEVVTDGVTLTDADAWLEVMAMSSSGSPLGVWVSDKLADPLATPADHETSTLAWTTTGLSSPVKHKLSVSVSPVIDGYLIGRVVLRKSSTVVYVDPALRVA